MPFNWKESSDEVWIRFSWKPYRNVPNVGMARMAGCIGSILAVPLLGWASMYLMAPASQAVRLDWTYRTMSMYRGRTGRFTAARATPARRGSHRQPGDLNCVVPRAPPAGGSAGRRRGRLCHSPRGSGLGVAVAIGIIGLGWVVRLEDRRYSLVSDAPGRLSGQVRRLNGVGRRALDPQLLRFAVTSVRWRVPRAGQPRLAGPVTGGRPGEPFPPPAVRHASHTNNGTDLVSWNYPSHSNVISPFWFRGPAFMGTHAICTNGRYQRNYLEQAGQPTAWARTHMSYQSYRTNGPPQPRGSDGMTRSAAGTRVTVTGPAFRVEGQAQ
jgi:hypothetical protein